MIHYLNNKIKETDKIITNLDNEIFGNSSLYIGNLSQTLNEEHLYSLFEKYGAIENIKLIKNEDKSLKNIAFITFKSSLSAQKAKNEMNDVEFLGNPLKIGY